MANAIIRLQNVALLQDLRLSSLLTNHQSAIESRAKYVIIKTSIKTLPTIL